MPSVPADGLRRVSLDRRSFVRLSAAAVGMASLRRGFAVQANPTSPLLQANSVAEQDAVRLQSVENYADTVLKDAADRYHFENPSPLLAGGINVYTKEQL